MRSPLLLAAALASPLFHAPLLAADTDALRAEMARMRAEYEARIQRLERRLAALETTRETPAPPARAAASGGNALNPALSVILDGKLTAYSRDPDEYRLPGFPLAPEAGLPAEGPAVGHTELTLRANVDDLVHGAVSVAIAEHDGATELELEEAYIEAPALGGGLGVKAGRFYSSLGYLNGRHAHSWDFADLPLVYRGVWGGQLNDDALQLRWLAPTPLFLQAGVELGRGRDFPAAGDGGARGAFLKLGGDAGFSHSWQLGAAAWRGDSKGRGAGDGHDDAHGTALFDGTSTVTGLDAVWKWAPDGDPTVRNATLQAEWFRRREDGVVRLGDDEHTRYDGTQQGWYLQGVYQFMPRWRLGLRYDRLTADNRGADAEVLAEAGLDPAGHDPRRYSLMLDYSRSEFSRLRLQYNHDRSRPVTDRQWLLQYQMSLGAHGAHRF